MTRVLAVSLQLFWVAYAVLVALRLGVGLLNKEHSTAPLISYLVETGSMEPTIFAGDVIFIRPVERYRMNDIITFRNEEGKTITHRIVEEDKRTPETRFVTQGDNNKTEDLSEVSSQQVIGKYWFRLPWFGSVLRHLGSPLGMVLFITIPVGVLVLEKSVQKREAGRFADL